MELAVFFQEIMEIMEIIFSFFGFFQANAQVREHFGAPGKFLPLPMKEGHGVPNPAERVGSTCPCPRLKNAQQQNM